MRSVFGAGVAAAALALAVGSASGQTVGAGSLLASASVEGEVTREGYREAAEPICKANARANEKILRHVRSDFRADRLAKAGRSMLRAGRALEKAHRELKVLPRPAADVARLGRWLAKVKAEAALFTRAGRALKAGRKGRASALVVKLNQNATKANNLVIPFAFRSCRFEPSKYT